MRVRLAVLVPLAAALCVLAQGTAVAAATGVTISNYMFAPTPVRVRLGGQVTWTNDGPSQHTTTSDGVNDGSSYKGLGLWASGPLTKSATFSFTFAAAGTFPYHCSIHTFMRGTIRVPMSASPKTGQQGTVFTLKWASAAPSGSLVFDVQEKAPGGAFTTIENGVTIMSATVKPAAPGTYSFRARERNTATGAAGGYSPAAKIVVTAAG